jgi:hypothetical protein
MIKFMSSRCAVHFWFSNEQVFCAMRRALMAFRGVVVTGYDRRAPF